MKTNAQYCVYRDKYKRKLIHSNFILFFLSADFLRVRYQRHFLK